MSATGAVHGKTHGWRRLSTCSCLLLSTVVRSPTTESLKVLGMINVGSRVQCLYNGKSCEFFLENNPYFTLIIGTLNNPYPIIRP
jgi:hypothetical protein